MRFSCGLSKQEKIREHIIKLKIWHKAFALWPTRINGTNTCAWLEVVERRATKISLSYQDTYIYEIIWEYRLL